mmetsp:Transcript_52650/g.124348  ORF Transcript_52650/g.124348 Transcript_52650/m.124348 type:complete len:363 (-) Transcript_52650:1458-2546(-)
MYRRMSAAVMAGLFCSSCASLLSSTCMASSPSLLAALSRSRMPTRRCTRSCPITACMPSSITLLWLLDLPPPRLARPGVGSPSPPPLSCDMSRAEAVDWFSLSSALRSPGAMVLRPPSSTILHELLTARWKVAGSLCTSAADAARKERTEGSLPLLRAVSEVRSERISLCMLTRRLFWSSMRWRMIEPVREAWPGKAVLCGEESSFLSPPCCRNESARLWLLVRRATTCSAPCSRCASGLASRMSRHTRSSAARWSSATGFAPLPSAVTPPAPAPAPAPACSPLPTSPICPLCSSPSRFCASSLGNCESTRDWSSCSSRLLMTRRPGHMSAGVLVPSPPSLPPAPISVLLSRSASFVMQPAS